MAGQLSSNVRRAIETRLRVLSRGASVGLGQFDTFRGIPPLLSCDFELTFWEERADGSRGLSHSTSDFMLTDLNGVDGAGLSWTPDSHDGLVPLPDVKVQYFTIQFYVSSDVDASPRSFPSLFYYERQFTDDGLLEPPTAGAGYMSAAGGYVDYRMSTSLGNVSDGENAAWFDYGIDNLLSGGMSYGTSRGWLRPNITLSVILDDKGDRVHVPLCHFKKCTFGTPHQSFAVGQTAAMQWTQQVGFRDVVWGNKSREARETFWDRAWGQPVSPAMVRSVED